MPSKVLLAGSDRMLQQMANTFDAGQIHTASVNDGYEALCLLNETTPDLLIAEIALPHKDGYALCRYVRQEPEFESLPVILLDREFNVFNQRRALGIGADVYMSQPFTPDELIEAVHRLLEDREDADEAADDEAWSAAQVATRPQPVAFADDDSPRPAVREKAARAPLNQGDFDERAALLPPPPLPRQRPNRLLFAAVGIAAMLIGIILVMLLRTTGPAQAPGEPSSLDKSNGTLATAGQPYVTAAETEAQVTPVAKVAASPSESDATTPSDAGGAASPDGQDASAASADSDTAARPDAPSDTQKVEARPDESRDVTAPADGRGRAPAVGERRPYTPTASPRTGRSVRPANHWRRGGEEMVASGEHFGSGAKHFSKGSAKAAAWAGRKAGGGVKRIGLAIKRIF